MRLFECSLERDDVLLGGPFPVPLHLAVDELLDEDLVIVGRTGSEDRRLYRRSWWRLVLHHLQVYPLPAPGPLDLVQLLLDLTQTVLYGFPPFIYPRFDAAGDLPENVRKCIELFLRF